MADAFQFDLVSPERRLASVEATEVQILESTSSPLLDSAWADWGPTIEAPAGASARPARSWVSSPARATDTERRSSETTRHTASQCSESPNAAACRVPISSSKR